jgi:hypothetical protein
MWKRHVVYESRPRSVIVSLGGHLYRIPEVVLTTVPPKKCHKVVSHLIQVDIGGHPPFPTGSKQFSGKFGNLLFLAVFNFRGHFEGPNEGFSRSRFSMISKA